METSREIKYPLKLNLINKNTKAIQKIQLRITKKYMLTKNSKYYSIVSSAKLCKLSFVRCNYLLMYW